VVGPGDETIMAMLLSQAGRGILLSQRLAVLLSDQPWKKQENHEGGETEKSENPRGVRLGWKELL
jgi:hypothetical protein